MNRFLRPGSRPRKPYDKENLKRAYEATFRGMSVYRAARVYSVPESTLRDRTMHLVDLECKGGPERIFTFEEEKNLVDHIMYMANIGYGYSVIDIRCMAADYGRSLGKTIRAKGELSPDWFYAFMNRWDQLKAVKPQKLGLQRAKTASKEALNSYFEELGNIIFTNQLVDAPERIWNIDESGFSTEHSPPKIVCAKDTKAQAVTSARSKNVTIVGGINALGNHVPPFYIFPGKRWNDSFLDGAVAGSVGRMSESGWINRGIFEEYVIDHLGRYAGIDRGEDRPATLILYDGHKSHLSLTLTTWAKDRNVILYVLPPHSSHLTQPLDVGVFGPMKAYYNTECRSYMHQNPGVSITTKEMARLTAKPFIKAFSTENITSAFRKSGIYPYNNQEITEVQTAPAVIYQSLNNTDVPQETPETTASFLDSRKITQVVQRPKKTFNPPIKIVGNMLSGNNVASLLEQQQKRESLETKKSKAKSQTKNKRASPKPSTSGLSVTTGKPLPVFLSDTSSDSEAEDGELCCVCKQSSPSQLQDCMALVFVKWGQCDVCGHWVHLSFCTDVRVLRRGSFFRCPHCLEK